MAAITNLEPDQQSARLMAFRTPEAGDRVKGFARARRHTRSVRILRWLFPMTGAGLVAVYVAVVLQTMGFVEGLPQIEISQIIPENLTMHNPRYEGYNSDGGTYVVSAKTAVQDLTDLSRITLNEITGDLTDANKSKTQLTAAHGFYNSKANELELYDGIEITSESGLRATLSRATVLTKKNIIYSKEPVTVGFPAGTIRSKEMLMKNKTRQVTFLNDVVAHLVPKTGDEAIASTGARSATGAPIISASNGPIDIKATRLDVDDTNKLATFSGGVRAVQGDATLETAALNVSYLGQMQPGQQAPPGTDADGAKISRIVSNDPVVLTRGTEDRVTAKTLDFDAAKEVTVLQGDVVMTSGDDRRASGNMATMDQKADTIVLTGNVVAIQGRNTLSGERLFVDRKTGQTRLTSPATPGSNGPGRIKTRFYRDAPTGSAAKSTKQSQAAAAAAGVFQTDPNAPIDVEADRLEVDDRAKQAVFKGNVRVAQGDFVVRTSTLRTHYTGQAGLADQKTAANKKQAAQLTRIQAQGKVIVTSKNGQDATGDWADFDMKDNKVTLGGDVVLTQEKNVVRGTQLTIDMTTGKSTIHNDPGAAWTAKADPAGKDAGNGIVVQGPTGGRPSAIFYPRKKKSGSKKSPEAAPNSPSGGAWGAPETTPQ